MMTVTKKRSGRRKRFRRLRQKWPVTRRQEDKKTDLTEQMSSATKNEDLVQQLQKTRDIEQTLQTQQLLQQKSQLEDLCGRQQKERKNGFIEMFQRILPEEELRMTDCRSNVSDLSAFPVGDPQFNKVLKAILGLCLYLEPDITSSANELKICTSIFTSSAFLYYVCVQI